MHKEQLRAVWERVARWPEDRQQQLAELAAEIEAEMSDKPYQAAGDELDAIDEGLAGETASEADVEAAFTVLRRG